MSKSKSATIKAVTADQGATMVEYALIVGGVALFVVIGAEVFGLAVLSLFSDMASAF